MKKTKKHKIIKTEQVKGQIKIRGKLLIVCLLLLVPLLIALISLIHSPKTQSPRVKTGSNQITPYFRDSFLDSFIDNSSLPGNQPLDGIELSYKDALPQIFFNRDRRNIGSLVVTSDQDNTRIILDANLDESHHAPISGDLPSNFTPFKLLNIPEGYYTVIADKDRYIPQWIVIRIEHNKVTRLMVHLQPADLTD